jgi:hypothetical protein
MTPVPKNSPWGTPQTCDLIAPGIWFVSTPSHGGYKLDPVRNAKVPEAARRRGGWYEEDCEWVIVALVFPEVFSAVARMRALPIAKNWMPDEYTVITGKTVTTEESQKLRRREFERESHDKFVVRAAWGDWEPRVPKGMVGVLARRASTGEEAHFLVDAIEYANRKFDFVIDEARHTRETPP